MPAFLGIKMNIDVNIHTVKKLMLHFKTKYSNCYSYMKWTTCKSNCCNIIKNEAYYKRKGV